jgi:hypothetical protein
MICLFRKYIVIMSSYLDFLSIKKGGSVLSHTMEDKNSTVHVKRMPYFCVRGANPLI